MDSEHAPSPTRGAALERSVGRTHRPGPASWNDIGDGFETLGKIGLAMAVGFSAAGLFCRLAQQGKVKVPPLNGLLLSASAARSASGEPAGRPS